MFKFDRGDHVRFVYGSVFSLSRNGAYEAIVNGGKIISRKSCGSSGGHEYRVAGFSGWWPEENLVLVSRASKNSPSREEAGGPGTLLPEEQNKPEGQNKAFWDFSVLGYAKCSSCERSFEALPTVAGFKANNKFCRMCGKAMEVKDED